MRRSRAALAQDFDAGCVVLAGIASIYLTGGATAFGLDPFFALLASFAVIIALVLRDFFSKRVITRVPQAAHPLAIALGFLAAGLVVSSILVDLAGLRGDMIETYRQVAMLLAGMSAFLLAYQVTGRQGVGTIIVWIANSVIAICTISIGLDLTGISSFEIYGSRSFGFLGDSVALLLTFPALIYYALGRRLLLALALLLLLITLSRGPLVIVLLGILLITGLGRGSIRSQLFILICIAIVFIFTASNFGIILIERFTNIDITDGRILTPMAGIDLFAQSPIYGHGYAALGYHYPAYDNSMAHLYGRYREGVFPTATSTWVQVLSDGGLILASPFFLLITLAARYFLPRVPAWLSRPGTQDIGGASAWIIIVFFAHHSSSWFLAGAPVLPLTMTILGVLTGATIYERQRRTRGAHKAKAERTL